MGISLQQYRATIGGFTPPGSLKSVRSRRASSWRELWGEVTGERVGNEGKKQLMLLVNVFTGFFLVATWFFLIRQVHKSSQDCLGVHESKNKHPHPLIYGGEAEILNQTY